MTVLPNGISAVLCHPEVPCRMQYPSAYRDIAFI
jgi:hypothetical protein